MVGITQQPLLWQTWVAKLPWGPMALRAIPLILILILLLVKLFIDASMLILIFLLGKQSGIRTIQ